MENLPWASSIRDWIDTPLGEFLIGYLPLIPILLRWQLQSIIILLVPVYLVALYGYMASTTQLVQLQAVRSWNSNIHLFLIFISWAWPGEGIRIAVVLSMLPNLCILFHPVTWALNIRWLWYTVRSMRATPTVTVTPTATPEVPNS